MVHIILARISSVYIILERGAGRGVIGKNREENAISKLKLIL
jgi:hypothetical protein